MTKTTTSKKNPPEHPTDVVAEIQRRRKAGHPLASSAHRGDWLYAAAINRFGSWGAAVEAAGYEYARRRRIAFTEDEVLHLTHCQCVGPRRQPAALTRDEVLHRIRSAVARGEPLRVERDSLCASGARHHFGSWKAAVEAAGFEAVKFPKWTAEAVVAQIREDLANGLSVNASAVIERGWTFYQAGRRRFGSWGAALKAADSSLPGPQQERPKAQAMGVAAKKARRTKSQ